MEIRVNLQKEKETANTYRYRGLKEFGTDKYQIYLDKRDVATLGDPDTITLTIAALQTAVDSTEE